jgi:putative oxidoreductase
MAGGKNTGVDIGLLVLRLALGGIFIAHGVQKLLGPGLEGFSTFVANLGVPYPYPAAVAALSAEIGGGILVVIGLFSRFGAISLAAVMGIAIWKVHLPNGFWLAGSVEKAGPVPNGIEYCLALLAMALCIVLAGPGGMQIPLRKPKKPGGP